MSLQLAAQHMASRGRGPDTTLVHMAPQEVAGLQALAKAHGGSLTINPETGLAEAGFLKSILPMVIGGALAATGVGAPLAAAMVGGGYGLATGSLSKGLMAGLGAYGGAGLAGGLMGAGAGAGAAGSGLSALDAGMGAMPTGTIGASALDAGMGAMPTGNIGASALDAGMGAYPGTGVAGGVSPAISPIQAQQSVMQAAPQTVTPMADRFAQAGRGFTNLGTEAGREAFMGNAASKGVEATGVGGGSGLMKYGLAGLAPMMFQEQEQQAREKEDPSYYSFDAGRLNERSDSGNYFNPTLTRLPARKAAGGGLMDLGPIQSMSDRNQAQMMAYNGGQMFAEGGETKAVKPVEENPYYTMSGQSGDVFKYLMGQGANPMTAARNAKAPAPAPAPAAPTGTADVLGAAPTGGTSGASTPSMFAFDPVTGQLKNVGPRLDLRPGAANPFGNYADTGGGGYGYGGGGPGGYGGDYGAGFAAAGASDFGGSDAGGYGGGDTSGGYGGDAGFGAANGGLMQQRTAMGGISALARGGASHLGDYSDGGRLLKGPGDGVSDSIPATIADKRPARLADGEFVVPARIVSELGNGSTEAGARKLYAMMDRVQSARKKSIGKDRVAVNSRAEKMLPA